MTSLPLDQHPDRRPAHETGHVPGQVPAREPDVAARIAAWAGILAGSALIVDTVTIAVVNGNFGVLDDALFLAGFAGMWMTGLALAVTLSRSRHGIARFGTAVGVFVAVAVVLGGVSAVMDQIGRHVFSDSNAGLHGEWSFFTIGVCLLGIAAWSRRRV